MRQYTSLAAVSVLALALAACGPAEEEEITTSAAEEPIAVGDELVDDGEAVVDGADGEADAGDEATAGDAEEPAPAASASATPTPKPSPTATATQVAAAGPPAAFAQCKVCHSVEPGQNGIGPSLAGAFGRQAGSVAGFSYTPGMRELNVPWNQANLNRYLTNPQGMVPGTTMAIGPLNATERTAIINYMKTL